MYSNIIVFLILIIFSSIGHSTPIVYGSVCDDRNILDPIECSNIGSGSSNNQTITNPNKKSIVNYPYMIYLHITFRRLSDNVQTDHVCGGILIESDVILTAGHCITATTDAVIHKIIAYAGVKNIDYRLIGGQNQEVKAYQVHENYASSMTKKCGKTYFLHNDLAILWVRNQFTLTTSKVQKAHLAKKFKIKYEIGTAIGWGNTEKGYASSHLLKAKLKVIKSSECEEILTHTSISKNVFCVIDENKQTGLGNGDSGGPFIVDNIVYGIFSFFIPKYIARDDGETSHICDARYPQVFTNLYKYKSWIKLHLKSGPPKKICTKYEKACALQILS